MAHIKCPNEERERERCFWDVMGCLGFFLLWCFCFHLFGRNTGRRFSQELRSNRGGGWHLWWFLLSVLPVLFPHFSAVSWQTHEVIAGGQVCKANIQRESDTWPVVFVVDTCMDGLGMCILSSEHVRDRSSTQTSRSKADRQCILHFAILFWGFTSKGVYFRGLTTVWKQSSSGHCLFKHDKNDLTDWQPTEKCWRCQRSAVTRGSCWLFWWLAISRNASVLRNLSRRQLESWKVGKVIRKGLDIKEI